ncbi:putative Glycosyltransferase [Tenacibaculum sediminilitoris]|uniref:hypothetical protein n=1 Tax=Tenacibaculum sediminilitoris TaxID=1820334 RepID=UPI0038930D71
MKIALIGPGYGHNIEPYLNSLNNSNHEVDFYFHNKSIFELKYKNIQYFKLPLTFIKLFFLVRKYDVIWLMGGGRLLYLVSFLSFFKKGKCKLVIFPYSEVLPRRTTEESFSGKITLLALSRFTLIHCGWFGIADLLHPKLKKKAVVHPMGLNRFYYKSTDNPDPDIVRLLEKVDKESYNFYYPKSFTRASRHDLVIEAVNELIKEEDFPDFKVYFIGGNAEDIERYNELIYKIGSYKLENKIIVLKKEKFFKTEDINLLWSRMDCGLQIAEHDGISTTIFEPLINKKELIISDIPPYKYLKSYFGFELELTPLNTNSIKNAMKSKVNGVNLINSLEKEKIHNIIKEKYSFETNINKLLLRFEKTN